MENDPDAGCGTGGGSARPPGLIPLHREAQSMEMGLRRQMPELGG
jgi:hypothetical protein